MDKESKGVELVDQLIVATENEHLFPAGTLAVTQARREQEDARNAIIARLDQRDELLAAVKEATGYFLNAKIDLGTGETKATASQKLEAGLQRLEAAIARAESTP